MDFLWLVDMATIKALKVFNIDFTDKAPTTCWVWALLSSLSSFIWRTQALNHLNLNLISVSFSLDRRRFMKFIDMLTYFQQWADCSVQIEWKKSPLHFHYYSAYDATSIHNDSLTNPDIIASYSYKVYWNGAARSPNWGDTRTNIEMEKSEKAKHFPYRHLHAFISETHKLTASKQTVTARECTVCLLHIGNISFGLVWRVSSRPHHSTHQKGNNNHDYFLGLFYPCSIDVSQSFLSAWLPIISQLHHWQASPIPLLQCHLGWLSPRRHVRVCLPPLRPGVSVHWYPTALFELWTDTVLLLLSSPVDDWVKRRATYPTFLFQLITLRDSTRVYFGQMASGSSALRRLLTSFK